MTNCSILAPGRSNGPVSASARTIGDLLLLFSRLKDLEAAHESVVDAHHSACVVELTAVVGCGEQRDQLPLREELVAVFNHLMGAADQVDVVLLVEGRDNLLPEGERDSTVVLAPALHVLVGVRPEQVAEEPGVGHVGRAHDTLNLLEGAELGAETTVHAEDLLVDDGGDGQAVEAVGEGLPQLDVVAALALVIETVDAVDGRALVVASQQEEVLGVLDLVSEQQAHGLEGLLAAVYVVTQEEVVGVGWESTVLEKSQQVVVLAVHITYTN